jgi:FtsZ-interacting cell division protein ZipA
MSRWLMIVGAFVIAAVLTSGLAFGQPKADCKDNRVQTPEKVEGQVVNVDQSAGKVTIRDTKGRTHEFQATRETLQEMKPGDRIEARLREAPKC